MNIKSALNEKYGVLCSQLGQLAYKRSLVAADLQNLDTQIAEVSVTIKTLNNLAPELIALGQAQNAKDQGPQKTDN